MATGEVYTFGKHGEGQLGRSTSVPPSEEGGEGKLDDETWHLSPQLIPSLGDGCKVVWVGARGNQTFVAVNESLVFDQSLGKCQVFADSQTIGTYMYMYMYTGYVVGVLKSLRISHRITVSQTRRILSRAQRKSDCETTSAYP